MAVGEGGLDKIWDSSDAEGELGREAMRDARDLVSEVGVESVDKEEGGGTGMGDMVTSVTTSAGSDVMIS